MPSRRASLLWGTQDRPDHALAASLLHGVNEPPDVYDVLLEALEEFVHADFEGSAPLPEEPTYVLPGPGKVDVMAARYESRVQLFHPSDDTYLQNDRDGLLMEVLFSDEAHKVSNGAVKPGPLMRRTHRGLENVPPDS